MIEVVGVRFKQGIRTYYFDPNKVYYRKKTDVIVETKNGLEVGTVVFENKKVAEEDVILPLKGIIRKVSKDDYKKMEQNTKSEQKAETFFKKSVLEEKLDMQLVEVRYNFDGTHVVFSYTADDRVDFRNLVKKLAQRLHVRVEMRQINMREKARLIGGIGPCGYDLCCNTFLQDLHGSTIKMVKNQKLTLVPERISGLCGKLLCCLRYENDTYTELAAMLPDVNQMIQTPDGIGKVIYVNVLTQKIDVLFMSEAGAFTKKQYDYEALRDNLVEVEKPKQNDEPCDVDGETEKALQEITSEDIGDKKQKKFSNKKNGNRDYKQRNARHNNRVQKDAPKKESVKNDKIKYAKKQNDKKNESVNGKQTHHKKAKQRDDVKIAHQKNQDKQVVKATENKEEKAQVQKNNKRKRNFSSNSNKNNTKRTPQRKNEKGEA